MIRKFLTTTLVILFLATLSVNAQLRIGFMNTQEVLNQLPEREKIENEINDFISQRQQQLQARTAAFQDSVAQYQENQSSMTEAQRKQREQELTDMQTELNELQQSYRMDVQRKRNELLQPIFDRINRAIEAIAKQRGLDFVINEATGMGESIVFYASNDSLDITEEVLNRVKSESTQN